jgi:predicted secreted protein
MFNMFKEWDACVVDGVATLRCLPIVFQNVISAFLLFVGAVALFLIIYSGIRLVTSGGDPKQVEGARKIMTYAIIGAVIVLLSFAIIAFIGYITGSTDCITNIDSIATGGCK